MHRGTDALFVVGGAGAGGSGGVPPHDGEDVALGVDDGDVGGCHAFHRRGGEVHDGRNLFAAERDTVLRVDEDGCRGVGGLRDEDCLLRNRQVHGGALDAVQGGDGGGEFTLHRPLVGDRLLELGGRDAHLVEKRVTTGGRGGNSRGGGFHPLVVHLVFGDQDGAAAFGDLVGDTIGAQLLDDGTGIRSGESGEQRAVRRLQRPGSECGHTEHEHGDANDGDGALGNGEFADGACEAPEG